MAGEGCPDLGVQGFPAAVWKGSGRDGGGDRRPRGQRAGREVKANWQDAEREAAHAAPQPRLPGRCVGGGHAKIKEEMFVEDEPSPACSQPLGLWGRGPSARPGCWRRTAWLRHSLLGRAVMALMALGPQASSHGNKSSQRARVFHLQSAFLSSVLC